MNIGYTAAGWTYLADEHHIYGSSRVGVHNTNFVLAKRFSTAEMEYTQKTGNQVHFIRGKRNYELSNHLGNVQVVISDKRISVCDHELQTERFEADILMATDYYPFGMAIPDRQWYTGSDSSNYRYGFNNQEIDNEFYNSNGSYINFEFRGYDSRLGRFIGLDPLTSIYPFFTPYQFAGNMPIRFIDYEGLEPAEPGSEKGQMRTAKINGSENPENYRWDWNGETWENKGVMLNVVEVEATKINKTIKNESANPLPIQTPAKKLEVNSNNNNNTPWMTTALIEHKAGVKEVPKGSNSGPKVDVYLRYAGVTPPNPWCASFVHWCLGQNGIKGAGASGENYLKWGTKLETPKYGAIVVFTTNHVGFYMGKNSDGTLKILHGNWSDKVTISSGVYDPIYPKQIKAYRWPKQ